MSDEVENEPGVDASTVVDMPPAEETTPVVESSRRRKSRKRSTIEWVLVVVAAVIVSLLLRSFVFQTFYVPSGSMNPTFVDGDRIVVNKLAVRFGTVHTGDIIVFKAPALAATKCDDDDVDYVKRVIGVPGDHLTSKGNTIYINGVALKEKWTHIEPIGAAIGHITVPKNDYFVMGDNHPNSCDSRTWGFVPKANIIGKVFMKYWPLHSWHWY